MVPEGRFCIGGVRQRVTALRPAVGTAAMKRDTFCCIIRLRFFLTQRRIKVMEEKAISSIASHSS